MPVTPQMAAMMKVHLRNEISAQMNVLDGYRDALFAEVVLNRGERLRAYSCARLSDRG